MHAQAAHPLHCCQAYPPSTDDLLRTGRLPARQGARALLPLLYCGKGCDDEREPSPYVGALCAPLLCLTGTSSRGPPAFDPDTLLHDVYTFHRVDRYVFAGLLAAGAVFMVLGVIFFVRARRQASAEERARLLGHVAGGEHSYNPYGTA